MGWASTTLQYFPPGLVEFYREHPCTPENKAQLKTTVDAEYTKWKSELACSGDFLFWDLLRVGQIGEYRHPKSQRIL